MCLVFSCKDIPKKDKYFYKILIKLFAIMKVTCNFVSTNKGNDFFYFKLLNFIIMTTSQMNHSAYIKKVKTLSEDSLKYIIKDCRESIDAIPNNPKNGYYMDEIHYCSMELLNRKNKGKK